MRLNIICKIYLTLTCAGRLILELSCIKKKPTGMMQKNQSLILHIQFIILLHTVMSIKH